MDTLLQDIRYGWRMLVKNPAVTTVIVLMLAIGIGANTAVFTIFRAILLQPLPYDKPAEIVSASGYRPDGAQEMPVSFPNFSDMRDQNQVFSQVGAYSETSATLMGKEGAEQIDTPVASAGFFETLGVKPIMGRTFELADEHAVEQPAVMLTYGGWQRRFNGDPQIVGKTLVMDGKQCTIVGVLPRNFQFGLTQPGDIWTSLILKGWKLRRNAYWLNPVGRLKPGMSLEQAQAGLQTVTRQLEQQYPSDNKGISVRVTLLRDQMVGTVRPILQLLMATVGFVLLITCANVAGLLLARSVQRQREISVRTALGAGRSRLVRQMLTESTLLALIGGAVGSLAAYWTVPAVIAVLPKSATDMLPSLSGLHVEGGVLIFTLVLSLITGIGFGIIPAIQVLRPDLRQDLQEVGRASVGSLHHRFRNALVVSEVALAVVLLVGAGLMLKSLRQVLRQDPGFKTENLLTLSLSMPQNRYPDAAKQLAFQQQLLEAIRAIPGVDKVAAVSIVPLSGAGNTSMFDLEGHPKSSGGKEYEASSPAVSTDYFNVMGIPLLAGRFFAEQDSDKSTHVVIINQALADLVFPGQDPIGKRINYTYTNAPNLWEIVGVVGNEKQDRLDARPKPVVYDSFAQDPYSFISLVIRTHQAPETLATAVPQKIRELDSTVPVFDVATMTQIIAKSPALVLRVYPAYLLVIFSAIALLLAGLGLYALLAYSVEQRTRELGLRLALGAAPRDLLRLVINGGMKLSVIGAGVGIVLALGTGRLIASLLFGVAPNDITTLASVSVLLIGIAFLASYVPGRRATRVDPMVALRHE